MNCYFLSDIDAHFKINGSYVSKACKNLKVTTANAFDLFEFLPHNPIYLPAYSNKENTRVKLFNFKDNLICYPVYSKVNNYPFKILYQKEKSNFLGNIVLTVVSDGAVKFFIDGSITAVATLPFLPAECDFDFYQNTLFVWFKGEKTAIFIYSLDSKNLIFSDLVDEFFISSVIEVKKRYQTVTKTIVSETWSISETPSLVGKKDSFEKDYFDIHPRLLPLAFFQNVILGANVSSIVTPSLNERASSLKDFLGKVIKIIPSPSDNLETLLIKNDCLTAVKLEFSNRLISNLFAEDYF